MNIEPKDRLKEAREALELTQDEFSRPLGLKRVNITNLESGKVKISTLHALAMEHIYKINSNWLLDGQGEMFLFESKAKEATNDIEAINDNVPHSDLVEYFTRKEIARVMNWNLIKLEKIDPSAFLEINDFIKFKLKSKGVKAEEEKQIGLADGKKERKLA